MSFNQHNIHNKNPVTNELPKAQERFCKDPDKHWFVLRITYGRVLKAHDVLSTQESIEVYMPVIRNINGRNRRVTTPMLHSLLFVYSKLETIDHIVKSISDKTNTKNLISFYFDHFRTKNDGKNIPLIIPYNAMMNFIRITSIDNEHIRLIHPDQCHYRNGDLVRIIEGDFKGIVGRVARVAGQQRVVVELDGICMVTTAYIPSAFIKKI